MSTSQTNKIVDTCGLTSLSNFWEQNILRGVMLFYDKEWKDITLVVFICYAAEEDCDSLS